MDTELATLASSGASTLVKLMVTDGWALAREKFAHILTRRRGDALAMAEDLEETKFHLATAQAGGDVETTADLTAEWRSRLRRALQEDPEAATLLRKLIEEYAPKENASISVEIHGNTFSGPAPINAGGGNQYNNYYSAAPSPAVVAEEKPPLFRKVPETTEDLDFVVGYRPFQWELLSYAGGINIGLRKVRETVPDHASRPEPIGDTKVLAKRISGLMDELVSASKDLMRCFDAEYLSKALGEPGRSGDFRLIHDLSSRFTAIYSRFYRWPLAVEAIECPRPARRLRELASHMADQPIRDMESYVDDLVYRLNRAVDQAKSGRSEPIVMTIACTLTADAKLSDEFNRELSRLRFR